jgi:hypothetical protein
LYQSKFVFSFNSEYTHKKIYVHTLGEYSSFPTYLLRLNYTTLKNLPQLHTCSKIINQIHHETKRHLFLVKWHEKYFIKKTKCDIKKLKSPSKGRPLA